jgi:dihydropteroate synthase
MMGATAGIDIVRVHDVKETRKAIDTINALT